MNLRNTLVLAVSAVSLIAAPAVFAAEKTSAHTTTHTAAAKAKPHHGHKQHGGNKKHEHKMNEKKESKTAERAAEAPAEAQ